MRTIAVTNQKGGVGKTTTAWHVAVALTRRGARVLAVDLDAQVNLTLAAGVRVDELQGSMYNVLISQSRELADVILSTPEGFDLAPADPDLGEADVHLRASRITWHTELANALAKVSARYDYCLLDCPPALSALTINALQAADELLIPVSPEMWPIKGIQRLFETVGSVKQSNPRLRVSAIIPTLRRREMSHDEMLTTLQTMFPEAHIAPAIPVSAHFSRAARTATSVITRAPHSAAARAYLSIADTLANEPETHVVGHRERLSVAANS